MPGVANHCNNGETALGVTMRAQNGGTHLCVPCQRDRGWCDDRKREREGGSHVPKTGNGSSTRRNARGKVSPMKFFSPGTFSTAMNMQAKVVVTTSHPLTRKEPWKWSYISIKNYSTLVSYDLYVTILNSSIFVHLNMIMRDVGNRFEVKICYINYYHCCKDARLIHILIHIHSSSNGFEVILEDARGHARAWNSFGVEMRAVNWTSWNACAYLSSALTAPSHNNARMNMSSAFAAAPASHRHAHRQYVAGVIAFLSFSSSSRETYRSLQKSSIGDDLQVASRELDRSNEIYKLFDILRWNARVTLVSDLEQLV